MDVRAAPTPDPPPASVDDCTALRVRRLSRRVTQLYDEALAPHGLTIGQLAMLGALRRRHAIGITALANRIWADASTLSRLLRPLEAAGLISVDPDPADGRAKAIRLTERGVVKLRAAVPAWRDAQATLSARLGPARLAALRFLLDDAFDHLSS